MAGFQLHCHQADSKLSTYKEVAAASFQKSLKVIEHEHSIFILLFVFIMLTCICLLFYKVKERISIQSHSRTLVVVTNVVTSFILEKRQFWP